jgi:hypothetical protein
MGEGGQWLKVAIFKILATHGPWFFYFFIFPTRCHHYHLPNKLWSPLRWAFSPLVSILHSFIFIFIFLLFFSCYFSYYSFLLLTQCFLFYSLLYFLVLHFFISLYFTNFILFLYQIFSLFFSSCAKIFAFILNHVLSFVKGIERIIMNKYMQVF